MTKRNNQKEDKAVLVFLQDQKISSNPSLVHRMLAFQSKFKTRLIHSKIAMKSITVTSTKWIVVPGFPKYSCAFQNEHSKTCNLAVL